MKKIFLILAMSAILSPVSADILLDDFQQLPKLTYKTRANEGNFTRAESDDNAYVFGYCNGITTAVGYAGYVVQAAIEIPEELSQKWIGNTVTGIRIGFGQSSNTNVNAFVTYDLEGYPVTMQNAEMKNQLGWNLVVLNEPYQITGDPFYVGYQSMCYDGNFPVGVDLDIEGVSEYGDLIGIIDSNNKEEWDHIGKRYGNVSLQIVLSGDNNIPQNNAEVSNVGVPSMVQKDVPFTGGFVVNNKGAKPIQSIEYTFSIGGEIQKEGVHNFDTPIASGNLQWILWEDLVCSEIEDNIAATATLLKVNGVENENPDGNTFISYFNCTSVVFPQNVLVEEFTGNWCGNCPWGIEGMRYMHQKYGDEGFIGVAVHFGDPMQASSYWDFIQKVNPQGTAPFAIVNRSTTFYPDQENLEKLYEQIRVTPSFAGVEITSAEYVESSGKVRVIASTKFAYDISNANYQLAFVLLENNVGPYYQENYFAGQKDAPGNWGSLPAAVLMKYDEVARVIVEPFGIMGSITSNIQANTDYSYMVEIPHDKKWNLMNSYIVAMLLDGTTGEVVNSCQISSIDNAAAGVEGVRDEFNGVYKVFNTQGIKVLETKDASMLETLPEGIYIVNGKKAVLGKNR